MSNLKELPYAEWLEKSLQNVIKSDTQAICIMTKSKDGIIGSGYFDCSVADKILFAGFIQHDATIEALQNNGYIETDEEDVGEFEEDEEDYCDE